jgi:hypothetical protein
LQSDTNKTFSTDSNEDKKKELRRVYRKLKGVRSQLSVKIRELRKEIAEEKDAEDQKGDVVKEQPETAYVEHEAATEDLEKEGKEGQGKNLGVSMQFEVKALVDHKRRLRERFWKLQEEALKNK